MKDSWKQAIQSKVYLNRGSVKETRGFKEWLQEKFPDWEWDAPHLAYIIYHLELLFIGEFDHLIINMPPRHGKTELVTIRFPVWFLTQHPSAKIIMAAHTQRKADDFSRSAKRLAETSLNISSDSKAVTHWETTAGGEFISAGVGTGIAGAGADLLIIDDPIKSRKQAYSSIARESIAKWYTTDAITRLSPTGKSIIIQTRWHEADLTGTILAEQEETNKKDYKHISLPAIAEDNDPLGRQPGEALWPYLNGEKRYDIDKLLSLKSKLKNDFYALFQQTPRIGDGSFFKEEDVEIVTTWPQDGYFVRYWDKAGTTTGGDFSAGVLACKKDDITYIVDVKKGQWTPARRNKTIYSQCKIDRNTYGYVITWVEQDPGADGIEVTNTIMSLLKGFPVKRNTVAGKGSKELRATPLSAAFEDHKVKIVKGRWNSSFIDELMSFPGGRHDDQVDAAAGAYNKLNKNAGKDFGIY